MYFREFGIPARIDRCFTVEELEANIKKYNSKPLREVFQQVAEDYKQERMQKTMAELQRSLLNSTDVYLFPELL